uniref:Replication-associated protein n=1 Tax=Grus japonensis parvo-like hybrid virus TaxID=2794511 RepID=A0A8A4XC34_9VIRU|nr:MAG: replication protein [Grus japonensis parvo-like hybrid virus]
MAEVPHKHEDRQWDIRLNIGDDNEYLEEIKTSVELEHVNGKFKYILLSGVEVGTQPTHSDYQVRHIHAAVIFHNRASKASILNNWHVKEGKGYYMVPRNRDMPLSGWREHHIKEFSKEDPTKLVLFEAGELPRDTAKRGAMPLRSEQEKKMKTDDVIIDMRRLLEEGKADQAFQLYPRNYMQYGEKLKSMIFQHKKAFFGKHTDPHIYLYGFPGSGKTSLFQLIYPKSYKKDLLSHFFDLYDEEVHTHVILEDLDSTALEKLSVQFLKTICDEAGFTIDQKYKTPQTTRATILITSNQDLNSLLNGVDDIKDLEVQKAALARRFLHIRVDTLQRLLGVKLISDYERKALKKAGNEDPAKLYLGWNYNLNCPTGLPLKTVGEYQKIIRDYYYGQ